MICTIIIVVLHLAEQKSRQKSSESRVSRDEGKREGSYIIYNTLVLDTVPSKGASFMLVYLQFHNGHQKCTVCYTVCTTVVN